MKILVLSPIYPYPPEDGDRIRIYNVMKRVAKKHELHLLYFEEAPRGGSAGIFKTETAVRLTGPEKMLNVIRGIFSDEALNISAYASAAMRKTAKALYEKINPDLVYCYRLRMAPYAEALPAPRVIDIVDSLALYNERRKRFEKNPMRMAYAALDLPRILKRERGLDKNFRRVFINGGADASYLGNKNIRVAANGVTPAPKVKKIKQKNFTVGFLGNMEYAPNLDAALFFIKKIWKKIAGSDKNIKSVFAGDTKGLLKSFDGKDGIKIKGRLPGIHVELASWSVSVVPVRYGAGRQNKILDSWAAGLPVVATNFAAEGVYGENGVNMLTADSPDDFAEAVLKIKNSPRLAAKLAAGGAGTLKKHFNWEKNMAIVLKALSEAAR